MRPPSERNLRPFRILAILVGALLTNSAGWTEGTAIPLAGLEAKLAGAEGWYSVLAESACVGTVHVRAEAIPDGIKLTCVESLSAGPNGGQRTNGVMEAGPSLALQSYTWEQRAPAGGRRFSYSASGGVGLFHPDVPGRKGAFVDIPTGTLPLEILVLVIPHLPWADGTKYALFLPDGVGKISPATLAWTAAAVAKHRGADVPVVRITLTDRAGAELATFDLSEGRVLECTLKASALRLTAGTEEEVTRALSPASPGPDPAAAKSPEPNADLKSEEGVVEPIWTADFRVGRDFQFRDGTVYFIGLTAASLAGPAFALDGATGRKLWETGFPAARILGSVDRDILVLDKDEAVHRIDRATGVESSARPFPGKEKRASRPTELLPLAVLPDGSMIRATRVALLKFLPDGKPAWQSRIDLFSPTIGLADGRILVSGSQSKDEMTPTSLTMVGDRQCIEAFDAATGKSLWKIEVINVYRQGTILGSTTFSPAVDCGGAILYVSSKADLGATPEDLHLVDAATGAELWKCPTSYFYRSELWTPVHDGKHLFLCTGSSGREQLQAIDLANGQIRWEQRKDRTPLCLSSSAREEPLFALETLERGKRDGPEPFVVALDRETGALLWRAPAGRGSACIGDGKMFLGDRKVQAFRATRTGK